MHVALRFIPQHVLEEAMCTRDPAYLGWIEVADAGSGWVSFSLYLGTVV